MAIVRSVISVRVATLACWRRRDAMWPVPSAALLTTSGSWWAAARIKFDASQFPRPLYAEALAMVGR